MRRRSQLTRRRGNGLEYGKRMISRRRKQVGQRGSRSARANRASVRGEMNAAKAALIRIGAIRGVAKAPTKAAVIRRAHLRRARAAAAVRVDANVMQPAVAGGQGQQRAIGQQLAGRGLPQRA